MVAQQPLCHARTLTRLIAYLPSPAPPVLTSSGVATRRGQQPGATRSPHAARGRRERRRKRLRGRLDAARHKARVRARRQRIRDESRLSHCRHAARIRRDVRRRQSAEEGGSRRAIRGHSGIFFVIDDVVCRGSRYTYGTGCKVLHSASARGSSQGKLMHRGMEYFQAPLPPHMSLFPPSSTGLG